VLSQTVSGRVLAGLLTLVLVPVFDCEQARSAANLPSQSSDSTSKAPQQNEGIELLSYTEGPDFGPYLAPLYRAIKAKWYEGMPISVSLGERGRNVVQFRVLRDGTVPEDFVKVTLSSGSEHLDKASKQAVLKAAPFKDLPEKYSQPFIVLRFTFYYNFTPKKAVMIRR